jgi:hypothetical protein
MDVKAGLISREQHRLRVFENGALRIIFEPKGVNRRLEKKAQEGT